MDFVGRTFFSASARRDSCGGGRSGYSIVVSYAAELLIIAVPVLGEDGGVGSVTTNAGGEVEMLLEASFMHGDRKIFIC